jgi:hypothetical protein
MALPTLSLYFIHARATSSILSKRPFVHIRAIIHDVEKFKALAFNFLRCLQRHFRLHAVLTC